MDNKTTKPKKKKVPLAKREADLIKTLETVAIYATTAVTLATFAANTLRDARKARLGLKG